ncbi:MAG: hypothetical protein L6282_04745 [Candidatus Methanoperedenaceae archaeon]|nr:hypothetical protein [Candidatus Methanoperedenaceae archaeon]
MKKDKIWVRKMSEEDENIREIKDEENPYGDKWDYGYPLGAGSKEVEEPMSENACPNCHGENVELILTGITLENEEVGVVKCNDCSFMFDPETKREIDSDELLEIKDETEMYKAEKEFEEKMMQEMMLEESGEKKYEGIESLSEKEIIEKTKTEPHNPSYFYHLGKKIFKERGESESKWRESEGFFRKTIELLPNFYMAYYYLGRLHLEKGELTEAENNLKKSLKNDRNLPLPWPHYYLGKTLLEKGKLMEAKTEFKKALEINPRLEDLEAVRYYLRKSKDEFPETVEEVEELTENIVLSNHALVEWFETNLREFIKKILEKEHMEKWWRKGVPSDVRKKCASRMEECLEEERDIPKLYFADFYDYAKILSDNKPLFNPYLKNIKEWGGILNKLEKIRNEIMHSRGQYLSKERRSNLKEWCNELQKIIKNARAGS